MSPLLQVEGLGVSFGGVRALDDVDLTVGRGELVGVLGPNGAGKTTLVNAITGFVRVRSGRIRLAGVDLTRMAAHLRADRGLARTFQVARPYGDLRAWENVVVALSSPRARRIGSGRHGDRRSVALDLLEEVGFERDSRVPDRPARSLPAGFLRRLDLARCLALRAELVVCDELFSGLAPDEIRSLAELVGRLRDAGTSFVMVEHRLAALLPLADRFVALVNGRKKLEGSPRAVLDHPDIRAAYLGRVEGP